MVDTAERRLLFEKRINLAKNITGLAFYSLAAGNLLRDLSDPLNPLHLNGEILQNGADFALHAVAQLIPGGQSESGYTNNVKYLDFLLVGGFLYLGGKYIIKEAKDFIDLTREMGLKRFLGKEPVPKNIKPSIVIFSQSAEDMSDLVNLGIQKKRFKDTKKSPVVGVLLKNGIPSVLREGKMSYYLRAALSELGKIISSNNKNNIYESSGAFKSDELLFIALDRLSGIFPQYARGLFLDAKLTWSELVDITKTNPESLKGKKINIIKSKKYKLNSIQTDEKFLKEMAKIFGFELEMITPEEIFIKKISSKLQKIEMKKSNNEKINIVLLEQEHTLESFEKKDDDELTKSLKDMKSLFDNLSVKRIVANAAFSSISIDGEKSNGIEVGKLFHSVDLIILTGQSDKGIMEIINSMISSYKKSTLLDTKKITVVVDSDETAQLLKKKYNIDVFVPMSEAIKKFSLGKRASSK